jgi:hypothetical protein
MSNTQSIPPEQRGRFVREEPAWPATKTADGKYRNRQAKSRAGREKTTPTEWKDKGNKREPGKAPFPALPFLREENGQSQKEKCRINR